MQTNIKLIEVMNNTAPTATPAAEFAAETSQKQMEDNRDELLHDSHSPLFNLLRKWYREAQEKLTVKENALEEINIKHQAEINKKDAEIASLAAQKAKLNSALADSTREIEEATRTTFKHLAEINKKDTENARLTAQVAKGESALEETKIKHQAEINKKDFEIASLTAQKAKLNSLLAGSTREVERAIEIIGRFNNFTANDKTVYLPLATNMAANNMGGTAHEKTLCTETESYICQEIRQHNDVSMFNEEIRNPSNCFNNMRQNIKKRKLSNKPACVETESYICKETLEQNDVSWYNKKSRNLAVATDMENRKLSHEHVAKLNNDIGLVSESQQQEFPYEFWTKRYNALVAYKQQYEHSSCTKNGKLS